MKGQRAIYRIVTETFNDGDGTPMERLACGHIMENLYESTERFEMADEYCQNMARKGRGPKRRCSRCEMAEFKSKQEGK